MSNPNQLLQFNDCIIYKGMLARKKQQGFDDKFTEISKNQRKLLDQFGIVVKCKKGLKLDSPNQDDFFIKIDGPSFILGVFDGHGPNGHHVSNYLSDQLPTLIQKHPQWKTNYKQAYQDAFVQANHQLIQSEQLDSNSINIDSSGSTATLIHFENRVLHIAHVGDSRSILVSIQDHSVSVKRLTNDHKPQTAQEQRRIEASGGEVRQCIGDINFRVFKRGQSYPGLAMSRAFGDLEAQKCGVVPIPDVIDYELQNNDKFVIICSDGVWQFMTDWEVGSIVQQNAQDLNQAAERIAVIAWTRWIKNLKDSVDDITVVIGSLPD